MKKVAILLLIAGAGVFSYLIVNTLKTEPATGVVVVEPMEPVEVTPTETTTVVVDVPEPDPKPVDPEVIPEVVFEPLKFNGKRIGKFAKANGGKVMSITNTYARALIGFGLDKANLPTKVVKVGGDLYFKAADGTLYVAHKGQLIKL